MWLYRNFSENRKVVDFLNDNNHLINSVSITSNKILSGIQYVVFFRLNYGVFEHDLDE